MNTRRIQWLSSLIPLLISAFFFYGFNNAMTSIMPEYFLHLGGSELIAGVQNSCFILLAIILRLGFGPLADRFGPKRLLLLGALGFTVPTALLPFCSNIALAILLRALQAVGLAAFMPNVAFYVRESLPATRVPFGIGLARFASVLSLMIMPVVLFAVRDQWGNIAMLWAFVGLGAAGILLTLALPNDAHGPNEAPGPVEPAGSATPDGSGTSNTPASPTNAVAPAAFCPRASDAAFLPAPATDQRAAIGTRVMTQVKSLLAGIKAYHTLMVLPFVLGIGYGVLLAFGPLFTTSNFPTVNGGMVLTIASLGGLGGTLFASKTAEVFGQKQAIGAGILLNAFGLLLMAGASSWLIVYFVGAFLAGLGYFAATTLFVASLGTLKAASGAGSLIATQQSCLDLGIMLGNLGAGVLLNFSVSFGLVFALTAMLLLVGFVSSLVSKSDNR